MHICRGLKKGGLTPLRMRCPKPTSQPVWGKPKSLQCQSWSILWTWCWHARSFTEIWQLPRPFCQANKYKPSEDMATQIVRNFFHSIHQIVPKIEHWNNLPEQLHDLTCSSHIRLKASEKGFVQLPNEIRLSRVPTKCPNCHKPKYNFCKFHRFSELVWS
jgi:hypothetical protein